MKYYFLPVILLAVTNLLAQEKSHVMSEEEKLLMPAYLETVRNKFITKPNSQNLTTPPSIPVRAMAEWEEIDGLLVTWTSYIPTVREIVKYARLETTVYIVCSDSTSVKNNLTNNSIPLSNIKYLQVPFNSIWSRDYGQWNVYGNDVDSLLLVDWIYNRPRPADDAIPEHLSENMQINLLQMTSPPNDLVNTGGNFMVDGMGTAFSSELILEENPNKTSAEIDTILKRFMGVDRYIKMPVLPFDDIHHIDMHLKLLDEETLLWGEYPQGVADGPQIEANLMYVQSNFPSAFGTPYKIVRIPQPPELYQGETYYPDDNGDYLTYTNSVFVNKTVLVTKYRPEYDTIAQRIWQEALPGYNIQMIDCNSIISAGGAIHCITKEVGTKDPLLIQHQPLPNTTNTSSPYVISATIKHKSGIASATLYYRTDTLQPYSSVNMNDASGNWIGFIPPQNTGTTVYYYIHAEAVSGKQQNRPMPAPAGYWKFEVSGEPVSAKPLGNSEIKLYPNPARAIVCLELDTPAETENVSVFDGFGKHVGYFSKGLLNTEKSRYFFDASSLSNGVYIVSIPVGVGYYHKKLAVVH